MENNTHVSCPYSKILNLNPIDLSLVPEMFIHMLVTALPKTKIDDDH